MKQPATTATSEATVPPSPDALGTPTSRAHAQPLDERLAYLFRHVAQSDEGRYLWDLVLRHRAGVAP